MNRSAGRMWRRFAVVALAIGIASCVVYGAVTEIAYDDGTAEQQWFWPVGGSGVAVRFTPPPAGGTLLAARLFIGGFVGGPGPIEVHVWDANRNDVDIPIQVTPTQEGWFEVDLSSFGFTPTGDFYVGYVQLRGDACPRIGADTSGGGGRSFNIPSWQAVPAAGTNVMIRAVLGQSGSGDTELAYDDGTDEETRGRAVAGTGLAVRFSPPARGGTLLRARFFFRGFAGAAPWAIRVHVWDDNHQERITPVEVAPSQAGWFEVDLSRFGLTPLSDFYVGYVQVSSDSYPWLGVDTSGAGAGRSYSVPAWETELPAHANFMIRVVVGTPGAANRPPTVMLAHTPPDPVTTDPVDFVAIASDPDGDPLGYEWYVNGARQQALGPQFSRVFAAGPHTVRVVVSDGRGGTAEASVTVQVRDAGGGGGGSSHTYGSAAGWYLASTPSAAPPHAGVTMWGWNPVSRAYDRPTGLQPERGYWARLGANVQLSVANPAPTSDVTLSLGVAGWHMISAPWPYPKSVIQVVRGTETKSWADAVVAGWVRNSIYGYKATDGAYTMPTTLDPWYGYWLDAKVAGLTLRFVYASRTTSLDALEAGDGPLAPLSPELEDLPPFPMDSAAAGAMLQVTNAPNPITDVYTTTFRVWGSTALGVTEITVAVYDLSGKLLWQGSAAGAELGWRTDDQAGRYLANGVYVYQITAQVAGTTLTSGFLKLSILR